MFLADYVCMWIYNINVHIQNISNMGILDIGTKPRIEIVLVKKALPNYPSQQGKTNIWKNHYLGKEKYTVFCLKRSIDFFHIYKIRIIPPPLQIVILRIKLNNLWRNIEHPRSKVNVSFCSLFWSRNTEFGSHCVFYYWPLNVVTSQRTRSTKGKTKDLDNFCILLMRHIFYTRLNLKINWL